MQRKFIFPALVAITQFIPLLLLLVIAFKNAMLYNGFFVTTHGNQILGSGVCGAVYVTYTYIFWQYLFVVIPRTIFDISIANSTRISINQLVTLFAFAQNILRNLILLLKLVKLVITPYFPFNDLFILTGEYEAAIISVP